MLLCFAGFLYCLHCLYCLYCFDPVLPCRLLLRFDRSYKLPTRQAMHKAVHRYEPGLADGAIRYNDNKNVVAVDFSSVGTAIAAAEGFKVGYEKLFDMHKGSFFAVERVTSTKIVSRCEKQHRASMTCLLTAMLWW